MVEKQASRRVSIACKHGERANSFGKKIGQFD